jgi:hypothetical protein
MAQLTTDITNTVLLPVLMALVGASVTLLAKGDMMWGLVSAVVVLAGSWVYHVILP